MILTKLIIISIMFIVIVSFIAIIFMLAFAGVVIKAFIDEKKGEKDE